MYCKPTIASYTNRRTFPAWHWHTPCVDFRFFSNNFLFVSLPGILAVMASRCLLALVRNDESVICTLHAHRRDVCSRMAKVCDYHWFHCMIIRCAATLGSRDVSRLFRKLNNLNVNVCYFLPKTCAIGQTQNSWSLVEPDIIKHYYLP